LSRALRRLPLAMLAAATCAAAQPLPNLHFEPPAGFSGAPSGDPASYTAPDGQAVLHIYPFRRFRGNAQSEFGQSLFREHIAKPYREARPATRIKVESFPVAGAEAAYSARFTDDRPGMPRERLRVLVVSSGNISIVDVLGSDASAWQRHWPAIETTLSSLSVK